MRIRLALPTRPLYSLSDRFNARREASKEAQVFHHLVDWLDLVSNSDRLALCLIIDSVVHHYSLVCSFFKLLLPFELDYSRKPIQT